MKLKQARAYQQQGNTIVPVAWQPQYHHNAGSVHVSFDLGSYDHTLPLILEITPWQPPAPPPPDDVWTALPEWCTNMAGTGGDDMVSGLDHDANGNVYYTGHSNSIAGLPVTAGLVTIPAGTYDFIVGRFNEHYEMEVLGTWLTYMGGAMDDRGFAVAYDPVSDQVAACGRAWSNTTSLEQYNSGQYHTAGYGAIATFNAGSGQRTWCTQLKYPFSANGDPNDLAYDADGNLYVVGYGDLNYMDYVDLVGSADCFLHPGFPDPEWLPFDAFVCRFDGDMHLTWFTAFGGTCEDGATSVAIDEANGKLYMAGYTNSPNFEFPGYCQSTWPGDFPLCPGGGWFQDSLNAVNNDPDQGSDGFVTCFDLATLHEQWSTYFGSIGDRERITDLAVNSLGDLYAVGWTNIAYMSGANCAWDADGFPHCTPAGAYLDNSNLGSSSAHFIARFNPQHDLTWSTFLSGDWVEYGEFSPGFFNMPRLACDEGDNVFVHGSTSSGAINFGGGTDVVPMHWNTNFYNHQEHNDPQPGTTPAPQFDGYVVGFKPDCTIMYASFIGGIGQDFAGDVEAFGGRLYLCGSTGANVQFPLSCPTLPGYQPYCAEPTASPADQDGYIAQLQYDYTVGIEPVFAHPTTGLQVYPNPSSDKINVVTDIEGGTALEILDALGRLLKRTVLNGRTMLCMDVSDLAAGSYIVRVRYPYAARTAQFVKL